jgi:hypothetical protein
MKLKLYLIQYPIIKLLLSIIIIILYKVILDPFISLAEYSNVLGNAVGSILANDEGQRIIPQDNSQEKTEKELLAALTLVKPYYESYTYNHYHSYSFEVLKLMNSGQAEIIDPIILRSINKQLFAKHDHYLLLTDFKHYHKITGDYRFLAFFEVISWKIDYVYRPIKYQELTLGQYLLIFKENQSKTLHGCFNGVNLNDPYSNQTLIKYLSIINRFN